MSPTAPRIVVTGATGFLGSHILAALRAVPVRLVAAARDLSRLPAWFDGETRIGDLTDASYRRTVVHDADVVIHAGTWSSFWGHDREERERFEEPHLDLINQSVAAGVGRFIAASTVVLGTPSQGEALVADDAPAHGRAFWPHHMALARVEDHMREVALHGGTRMVSLRLGHFIGEGNSLGLVAALIPRLKTRQVPWVNRGRAHLPLVSGSDMARAFALAATVDAARLNAFEAMNIVGNEQPTAREVFTHIASTAGVPTPAYSVPLPAAYAFGSLMEALHPVLPGRAPFLTRSLVFVGENWHVDTEKARTLLGYQAADDWREVVAASVAERRSSGFAWPALTQA
jgi:nucleoside-diphosphate-sugar epimerase